MIKKLTFVLIVLCLLALTVAGCGQNQQAGPAASSADNADNAAPAPQDSGLTLAEIRQAAVDSGYAVSDDYQSISLEDVQSGFAVEIVSDNQDVIYSILECGSEEAAIQNAKEVDDAGYNIALRNGVFLTFYGVDKKDGDIKDILTTLLKGKPVPITPAVPEVQPADNNQEEVPATQGEAPKQEEPTEQVEQPDQPNQTPQPVQDTPAEQAASGSIVGTWASGNAAGKYSPAAGRYEGVSGMGLLYTFQADGTFAQLTIFGKYIFTTGKYSIKDGLLTLTDRVCEESDDNGASWGAKENLPDASSYFDTGTGDSGKYLLLGQEDATPPLNAPANALKFSLKE